VQERRATPAALKAVASDGSARITAGMKAANPWKIRSMNGSKNVGIDERERESK
jgi:hypothetical protein